ncbi:MAG: nucleotidyltransferase family protein [Methanocorpusculum sp.]|nr:nucleotidyltransferase family protein [Methanocorpusculum sp.]
MSEYKSIKEDVLKKLETNLPEIRKRFGIETIGIFGSVARGEDLPDSDVDIVFSFQTGKVSLDNFLDLADYLENLFSKKVDLIPDDGISPYLRQIISKEVVLV